MVAKALLPNGVAHHYAALRIVTVDANQSFTMKSDCRNRFEPMRWSYGYQFGMMGIGTDQI